MTTDTINPYSCACGETSAHEVSNRKTADGTGVVLWSDGAVTGRMGLKLPGVPMVRPRTETGASVALAAGWLLMGEIGLYDLDEVPGLYGACRWAATRNGTPGDVRARANRRPPLRPSWVVVQADRDGTPTERVWRLPRLLWPGLVVWDHVHRGARRGGRYEVFSVDRDNVCMTTGCAFDRLSELAAHLETIR